VLSICSAVCVKVQVTLPYHIIGLINVLCNLILLFRWICLDRINIFGK
jgi:hypothetical protein